jgi:hypothetical protein
MDSKKSKITINATVVAAIITFCGTVGAAILGSPVLAEYFNGPKQAQATAIPTLTLPAASATSGPTATGTLEATATSPAVPATMPPLPDLVTLDISSPVCVSNRVAGTNIKYVRQDITIRNIGSGSTQPFGTFSSRVVIIVDGQRYTLDQWAQMFNGLVEMPNLDIQSLGPNDDAVISLSLSLHGNNRYSLEVIANSGPSVIPEVDTTNNIQSKDFSTNCR